MAITSGDLNKLDTAMRQYFNAVYRASHAAYKDGFDLSARRAVISDDALNALRDKVTAAADPINQTVFTFDSYAARQVEKLAREAAIKDTRAGVDREVGLGKAAATFKSNGSLSIIAELDDSNAGARGVPGQTSHAVLIKEARAGNMLAQNYDTPGAPKSTGGGIIPSAHAAEPAVKKSHANLAVDYVLKGQSADIRKEVVRIMGAAEGRTTPEKLAYLSAALREGGDQTDPVLASNITRAIGVLNLKNQMDITGTTQWKNTNSEAYFNRALANADALREKQENGEDISKRGTAKVGAASGERARTYGYKGEGAPTETEIPVIAENQVEALQNNLKAAGFDVGPTGADGKYGPNTHKALKAFAAKMTPPITDLSTIDFTNPQDPEGARIMEALGAAQGTSEAKAAPAKAAPAKGEAEAKTTTVLQARFAKEIAGTASASSAAINYYTDKEAVQEGIGALVELDKKMGTSTADTMIKSSVVEAFEKQNLPLSKQQIANITVNKGIVYSPDLKAVETALGLVADGQLDERLKAILKIPEIQEVVAGAFKEGKLAELAEAAPQSLPGGKGNGAAKG